MNGFCPGVRSYPGPGYPNPGMFPGGDMRHMHGDVDRPQNQMQEYAARMQERARAYGEKMREYGLSA